MDKNDNIVMISKDIRANERYIRELLADCGDIQIRKMRLGDAPRRGAQGGLPDGLH